MRKHSPRRLIQTLRAMAPTVVITVGLSVAGLYVVRRLVPLRVLHGSSDAAGNYLQTLGTIYAVLLAWVVFVVWQQFNDARSYVEREANELIDLFRTAKGFSTSVRDAIHDKQRAYAGEVLETEWDAMRVNDDVIIERIGRRLDEIWHLLHTYEPTCDRECAIYSEALARFNDLSDARSNRILSSRVRIPLALRLLLYVGAVLTITSLYLFHVDRLLIHALMTGSLSASIAIVLYLIHDLDDCFDGDWQVPRSPFERVLEYMQRYQRNHQPPPPQQPG